MIVSGLFTLLMTGPIFGGVVVLMVKKNSILLSGILWLYTLELQTLIIIATIVLGIKENGGNLRQQNEKGM